ncbi:L,D-transpeptidase family protein [Microbulbifer rhizosphaerae]|uniref:Murein L,D-transpeptidase YcbB/YkuD n=1 Tax=Microbulbifer rhizosphaerae TaxID=1562603 RepID=A0A7W4Z9R0_9GAMM|nr:L,D-transpeptidase family protein [Microbulbifer rhizosphaerae]MBB3062098.1 murein L,D-transpeptidase YcbB/YkuD [Microbulbifer rhizosphaerae]
MALVRKRWRLLAAIACLGAAAAVPAAGEKPQIHPAHAGEQLRAQAAHYRQLAGHWEPIAPGGPLHPGDRGARVAQLRRLLQLYGDYQGPPGPVRTASRDSARFDSSLQRALENYQRRHGLEASGVAGAETLAELAVPPGQRARQLELNAERGDQLRIPRKERYVLINVPDYRLQLVQNGTVTLSMKTVVGKTSSRTPTLSSRITGIVFNPTWTVPRSILLTELLPKARNNPRAMHERGYRVVSYRDGDTSPISEDSLARAASGNATLRQVSGAGNTLGRVKFILPNRKSIFLHDTQAHSLFDHRERAFSHGCIRLERPQELAYALLDEQGWDRVRIAQATSGDETVRVQVSQPPRLFITYMTAWVDPGGRPQFRRDIYRKDDG